MPGATGQSSEEAFRNEVFRFAMYTGDGKSKKGGCHVCYHYVVRIFAGKRDMAQKCRKEWGVDSMAHYAVSLQQMKLFEIKCEIACNLKEAKKVST
ncbi:MAG: hypothetical protein KKH94_00810 [Candidatus Omnitrophica bacterium]|nr:hypothetical protein [Candidatus Omnitrophota bacterium]